MQSLIYIFSGPPKTSMTEQEYYHQLCHQVTEREQMIQVNPNFKKPKPQAQPKTAEVVLKTSIFVPECSPGGLGKQSTTF